MTDVSPRVLVEWAHVRELSSTIRAAVADGFHVQQARTRNICDTVQRCVAMVCVTVLLLALMQVLS